MKVSVTRKNVKFLPDSSRVVARYFMNGEERTKELIARILTMSNADVNNTLEQINREFARRHRNISALFYKHYDKVKHIIKHMHINDADLTDERKMLIGSYLTMEYSIESAAFFNPSIVEDFDQSAQVIYHRTIKVVMYFEESVRGLNVGAPVLLRGIPVGNIAIERRLFEHAGHGLHPGDIPRRDIAGKPALTEHVLHGLHLGHVPP